eukprot:TRINITY_DN60801_c0_g1_i1.p1 TRINITY_DN60801_c0_g1~~TRINITY_DN60801_c0_g1_i1.p1  ORF type:complete len:149 (-),score=26.02 TRINITY_DN60801_c0_g1_i1:35-481(-)
MGWARSGALPAELGLFQSRTINHVAALWLREGGLMPSAKKIASVRIARSLQPAELAVNQAALKVLAMGTAVLTARADGTFHPLEAQDAVDYVGAATAKVFGALSDIKKAHGELRSVGIRHQVIGEGDIYETPGHEAIEPAIIKIAAAA